MARDKVPNTPALKITDIVNIMSTSLISSFCTDLVADNKKCNLEYFECNRWHILLL